jgi:hypothetical protein
MTMPDFTVLIPTHDHSETLRYAVRSVQWQTRQDFELFIVGDGVPDRTRAIAAELMAEDPRIRFFDFPKGERHGELHRHQALREASGRFVCYQADDDLWFPDHLATMATLLEDHDLAHCMQIEMAIDGQASTWMFDAIAEPRALDRMRTSKTGFGLNSGGHRLDAYRMLPRGWHPAPPGINTDLYFWLQFLEERWCRYVSHKWPLVVHLSTVPRRDWSQLRRVEELAALWERIQSASYRQGLVRECLLPLHDRLLAEAVQPSAGAELAREIAQLTHSITRSVGASTGLVPYVLGEQIRFCAGGNATRHVLSGFSLPEDWGRWTLGAEASVVLMLEDSISCDLILELEILSLLHDTLRPACAISVLLNGASVLQVHETRRGINRYVAHIPQGLSAGAVVLVLGFAVASPARPMDVGLGADDRLLGLGLVTLRISAAAAAAS